MSTLDFWNGIVLIIFCALSIYVGLRIMSKYFKYRQRQLLFAGIVWISLASPWIPASISFIMVLLNYPSLKLVPYLIIGVAFIPVGFTLWIVVFTDLVYKKQQKLIIGIFIIYAIAFYIWFFYFVFIVGKPEEVGFLVGQTDIQFELITVIYFITVLVTALITGIMFSLKSMKSEDPELKLKGKLLLVAFISFCVGAGLDAAIPLTWITFPIQRALEILAAICFYGGFTLPNWMKKLLLRKKEV
jgi:hypothetical protein